MRVIPRFSSLSVCLNFVETLPPASPFGLGAFFLPKTKNAGAIRCCTQIIFLAYHQRRYDYFRAPSLAYNQTLGHRFLVA